MAHTVKITKLIDGARFVLLHVYIKSDGISSDLSGAVLLDPATVNPALPNKPSFAVDEIWSDLDGFNMRLDFDDLVDPPLWTVSSGSGKNICFSEFGGLADRSSVDGTGKLLLSTMGLDAVTKQGTMVIQLRKKVVLS